MAPGTKTVIAAMTVALGAALIAPGCLPEEQKTNYGGPEGLYGKELPKPVNVPSGSDSGIAPGGCADGGKPLASTNCAVSWKTDIFPVMKAQMHCGDQGCHMPQNPRSAGQQPAIDPNDPVDAYNSLVAYTSSKFPGKQYIDPCTTTPESSAILCNLTSLPGGGKAACDPLMPLTTTGGQVADQTFLDTKLRVWLACGAPNN